MKVLLCNSSMGGGGITTFASQLIECLSADTELTVVLGHDKAAPITNPKVKVIFHDTEALTIKNALFLINLINNVEKPDVVIASAALVVPVIAPYLNDNIKVFTVSHSGMNLHSDYCAVNHKYIDTIIAASSDYNKHYLEHKFRIKNREKVKVIYNFVAADDEMESLCLIKKDQRPISIVFAGAAAADKSPELVAQVVYQLLKTDLDFRFYWTGNPGIPLATTIFKHSKLKTVKQIMPDDRRLIFPGRIPDKRDYDRLLGSANIMFAPSKNEGCSMALLEGHRAGCIFVVADYENSNNEIVKKGNSGFVIDHRKPEMFVDVISDIIRYPKQYEYLYDNSHKAFVNMMSYPVWKEKIFEVLNSPKNHTTRRRTARKLGVIGGILKMKWLEFSGLIIHCVKLSLPSYLSFKKQYALFNKETK